MACGSTCGQGQFMLLDMKSSDSLFILGRIKHTFNQFSFCCFKDNKTTNQAEVNDQKSDHKSDRTCL